MPVTEQILALVSDHLKQVVICALNRDARLASLPSGRKQDPDLQDWLAMQHKTNASIRDATPEGPAEKCPDGDLTDGPSGSPRPSNAIGCSAAEQSGLTNRKVLVVFLGEQFSVWQSPSELIPYRQHAAEKELAASELNHEHKMPRYSQFQTGVQVAKELCLIKEGAADKALIARHAASRAAAVNLHARCQRCESCLAVGANKARCFVIRGAAAAASGHSGAQLAILGDAAIGAKVQVWWPLDENWYTGVITGFDELRFQHTVSYADGDVEFLKLWAPHQLIRVTTKPDEWPAEAAAYAARAPKVQANALQKMTRILDKTSKQAEVPGPDTPAVEETKLSPYELARMAKITANEEVKRQMLGDIDLPRKRSREPSATPSAKMPPPARTPPTRTSKRKASQGSSSGVF